MKLSTILGARDALQRLVAQPLPLRKAWELCTLVDELNEHMHFYSQEIVKCRSAEDAEALGNFEVQPPDVRIALPLDLPGLTLSSMDIKALEPFIDFEEGEPS